MTYKQILIHRCKIFVILFFGAQDVTKIDLILLKKGNKMTDIELSLKIINSSNTTTKHDSISNTSHLLVLSESLSPRGYVVGNSLRPGPPSTI